jgi:lysosomal alpha-glucosidase
MNLRFNQTPYSSFVISLILLSLLCSIYAQQCNQTNRAARFNCYPEDNPTESTCRARGCCWLPASEELDFVGPVDPNVPSCYYPADFQSYEVMTNQTTDFGQRFLLRKMSSDHLSVNILNLTVDLIYETEQRLRIQIYDTYFRRYQVPLPVPKVQKRVNQTDYEVEIVGQPFGIIVTRKSTNTTL